MAQEIDTSSTEHGVSFSESSRPTDIYRIWILAPGASHHITADISCLTNLVPRIVDIEVGGGRVLRSTYSGSVRLSMDVKGASSEVSFVLDDVLYI